MKKLDMNFPSNDDVIQLCYEGIIRDTKLKGKLKNAKHIMSKLFDDYSNKAGSQELYSLKEHSKNKNSDPKVILDLLHSELTYIHQLLC